MKKGDLVWAAALLAVIAFLVVPATHSLFMAASKAAPYPMGFAKFAVLASMGELLAVRIRAGSWNKPKGFLWRAVIWGLIGLLTTLMFVLYDAGVKGCMERGYLPFIGADGSGLRLFATAFMSSALMNLFFAPAFMLFHRLTDTWIDAGQGKMPLMLKAAMGDVLEAADLKGYVSFVVFKTVPIFWIPAHTITFMLPPEYRVLMAAMLSICLGVILGIAKKSSAAGRKQ
ncbi:MAG: Mpv17/PMP22 family protein [Clostridiales bacterium]|nr:Mpv17/PMP22 family protein [Clostridiales bacterium]